MERRRRIVLTAAFAHAAAFAQPAREKFDPKRDAHEDVAAAVARARVEGKLVIVDVGGEWCSWCHVMDRFIESNPDLRAAINADFVWIKVNYSPANKNEGLLSKWPKVAGYPHLFVLDASGVVVRSQRTSELESGSNYDKNKFMSFLAQSRAPR